MASIAIRNQGDSSKSRLPVPAAGNGLSMDTELHGSPRSAVNRTPPGPGFGTAVGDRFKSFGSLVWPEVPREPVQEPPNFK